MIEDSNKRKQCLILVEALYDMVGLIFSIITILYIMSLLNIDETVQGKMVIVQRISDTSVPDPSVDCMNDLLKRFTISVPILLST